MPNNERTHPDATWVDGFTPPASSWEDLERKIFGSWNGDKGGAYCAPQGPRGSAYSFGGAGLQVLGPTRLTYGGAIKGASGAFVIRNGAFPELAIGHAGRTRSIVCPIHSWGIDGQVTLASAGGVYETPAKNHLWSRNHPYAGVGSVALACRKTNSRTIETADLYCELRVIDGSTLEKVTVFFRVAKPRVYAPIAMPKIRILRVPKDSGDGFLSVLPEPLKDTTDGLGFASPPLVTSPSAWYANGEAQSFDYVCDQNNEIDVANYSYVVHIVEEQGAVSPDDPFDGIRFVERKENCYLRALNTATLNGGAGVFDQVAAPTGVRMLVTDTDDVIASGEPDGNGYSARNGIWIVTGADWTRSEDLDEATDFTPNWIVTMFSGDREAKTTWQCPFPNLNQRITLHTTGGAATGSPGKTQIRLQPAEPFGNIWHALVPQFSVSDLRFQ